MQSLFFLDFFRYFFFSSRRRHTRCALVTGVQTCSFPISIARFPGVPVEVWPIEEFTYLQPARCNGTRSAERMPHLERYWSAADPDYCDGEGAESFRALLGRCEAALARLAAMPPASLVYVFGHGQFIQAARTIVADADLDERAKMRAFWRKHGRAHVSPCRSRWSPDLSKTTKNRHT